MRILQIHNYYQQEGGEDAVLANEKALLEEAGHEVIQHLCHNDEIQSTYAKVRSALEIAYSARQRKRLSRLLHDVRPDIVHVHNFFPLFTPSIFDACRQAALPSVMTLHNYRLICPGALLMRDGHICEDCLQGSAYRAIWHRCYRESMAGTFAVSRMVEYHRRRHTWRDKVSAFIALTRFARTKYIQGGLPANRIHVKPNFIRPPAAPDGKCEGKRRGVLYVGRLSHEKGLTTLLEAWKDMSAPLRIAGDGPLKEIVSACASPQVEYLGVLTRTEVSREMRRASALVMPSEWYEGFPMVLVEAMAHGLPVIGSNIGAMAEVIQDGVTGLHFEVGDVQSLRDAVSRLLNDESVLRKMSEASVREYRMKYSPEVNLDQLMGIYESARQAS